jgi:hypothetical protein
MKVGLPVLLPDGPAGPCGPVVVVVITVVAGTDTATVVLSPVVTFTVFVDSLTLTEIMLCIPLSRK